MNPFYNHIFHEQICSVEWLHDILMNNLGKTMSLSNAESAYFYVRFWKAVGVFTYCDAQALCKPWLFIG
jgi:hypothetical protein